MSLSAAQMQWLADRGFGLADAAEFVRLGEASGVAADDHRKSKAADRMALYRQRRRDLGLEASFDGSRYVPALVARDGPQCIYCTTAEGGVVDHMHPISQGGTDDLRNLALACHACNCGKAGRTPEQAKYPIQSKSAAAAYTAYVREQREQQREHGEREHDREHREHVGEHVRVPRERVLDKPLTKVLTGSVVVVDASAQGDDWPTGKLAQQLAAAVESPFLDPNKSLGLVTSGRILDGWRKAGASWEHDVIPIVAALAAKRRQPINSWAYFEAAVLQSAADSRRALTLPQAGSPHERPGQHTNNRADSRGDWAELIAEHDRPPARGFARA